MLLHVMRVLRSHYGYEIDVLLARSGTLEGEFADLGVLAVKDQIESQRSLSNNWISKLPGAGRIIQWRKSRWIKEMRRRLLDVDLIYANSVGSLHLIQWLGNPHIPVVLHVHELEVGLRLTLSDPDLLSTFHRADSFIACSEAVRRTLVEQWSVDDRSIDLIYECIPTDGPPARKKRMGSSIREELGIPASAFVVGGCGTVDIRKGVDQFVALAKRVRDECPEAPIFFVWMGKFSAYAEPWFLEADVSNLGLSDYVRFIGERSDPENVLQEFDVLAMVSREDPFPLVNLEAGLLGIPILCFEGGGGTPELVRNDGGVIVPYLDIDAMARSVFGLWREPERRSRIGEVLRQRVVDNYGVQKGAARVHEVICRAIQPRTSAKVQRGANAND